MVTLTGTLSAANGITAADYTLAFKPSQLFVVPNTGLTLNTTVNCATSTDGTVVGLPNPLSDLTISPQFSGTLPPGNYFVEYTFYTASTETLPSPEYQAQLTSTGALSIPAPASGIPAGSLGMKVYIGATSGSETLQGVTLSNAPYLQSTPLATGANPPATNTTICQVVANDAGWPTGTSYKVTLLDPAGNSQPGYPMNWQLLGPGSTYNLGNGLPYYNGVVIYPTPLLANPYNHNPQSISSNLDFGGYNLTNVGNFNACTINGEIDATCPAFGLTTDLGDKVNAAFARNAGQGTVFIPPGGYTYSHPILLPMNALGQVHLRIESGAVLVYTGTGDGIGTTINTAGPTSVNLKIDGGGALIGTAAATSGIHIMPSNGGWIGNLLITGFSNGKGVWFDGANGWFLENSFISNNQDGVYATPSFCNGNSCGGTGSGASFTANAIHIHHNVIVENSGWGVHFFDTQTSANTGPLNDTVDDDDLENNGNPTAGTGGSISVGRSTGFVIDHDYFEGSPHMIQLGFPGSPGVFFASLGATVRDSYFTVSNVTPYYIEALDTSGLTVDGNSTNAASVANTGSCFFNETEAINTYFGHNQIVTTASGSTGQVSLLCANGMAEQFLSGAGSFSLSNLNYVSWLVDEDHIIGTSGQDVVTAGAVLPSERCHAEASQAGGNATLISNQALISQVSVLAGTGQYTINYPTGHAGAQFSIMCTRPLN